MHFLFAFLLSAISLFLILLVLVQRGRGGGLTGALGGMGGQSAFGTKAGDTFTRITIVTATIWILCAILSIKLLSSQGGPLGNANAAAPPPITVPGSDSTSPNPLDSLPTAPSTETASPSSPPAEANPTE